MEENSSHHICGCGKTFKQRSGLFKHSKKCDKATAVFTPLSRKPCQELNCQYTYRYIEELRKHLEKAHNFRVVTETLLFKSYEDFLRWKEEYEIKTVSSFTRNNVKKQCRTGGRSTEYYYCHRSGQYKCMSKGKRKLKAQGSLKINSHCTASLKMTSLSNNAVKVFVCHTHYGHKMDLCHVKISKRDREILASQMSEGIPKEKILHTLSPSNAVTLERKHLIMRKDLNNISRAFGVRRFEKAKQYRLNVDDYFQEVTREGSASVLIYKRRKEDVFIVPEDVTCPFHSQDYVFAFINQFQREVFDAYGNGVICFDVTTDCNADQVLYNDSSVHDSLKIFSILVIDEYGDAIPVAWLISNRDDSVILTMFFQQIKDIIGSVTPKAILTDRTSDYFNSWVTVFAGEPSKLLCSWNVYNEWREKISLVDDQDAASLCYQVLCLLLEEQDMAKFVILMQRCIKEMNENISLVEFGRYFCDEWAVIQDQWASCFRNDLGIETNCHVESIHQVFKQLFILEKFRKSPNKCLNLVLNFSSDINMKRYEKHEAEKTKILECHRIVSSVPLDVVKQVSPNTWYVTADESVYSNVESSSGNVYSLVYVVEEIAKSCSSVCNVKCAYCQICMHLYKCSCRDSKPGTDICEHSHLVALSKVQNCVPEVLEGNIILHEDVNHVDFGMLDHNYFEVAPKENQCTVAPSKQDQQKTVLNTPIKTERLDMNSNESISIISPDSQQCLEVYTIPKPQPQPPPPPPPPPPPSLPVLIQTDRRLGVPILPKPAPVVPLGYTATLLGIILIPNSSQNSQPSVEVLQNTLLQDIETVAGKVKTCTDRKTLLALQEHIKAAMSALEAPPDETENESPQVRSENIDHS